MNYADGPGLLARLAAPFYWSTSKQTPCTSQAMRRERTGIRLGNPTREVLVLEQPSSESIRNLLVMNFSSDEGTLGREKAITAAQNIVFATFYINFHQLGCGSAIRDEIIQRDGRYINQLSASENRALSVHLDAAMCPLLSSAPKGEATGGIGPYWGRNDSKSSC